MGRPLVIALAALALLSPALADAREQGRPDRGRGAERSQRYDRAAARDDRRFERRDDRQERRFQPPPRQFQRQPDRRDERPGPRSLAPGQVMPPGRGAQVQDFRSYRLRPPPPGYDWVQVGRDIYLTQRSTGMVLEAIPGGF